MSIKVTSYVWDKSKLKGTKLMMLLALADFCDDEGVCYPSVKRLAKKARVSESRARAIIADLKASGEIAVMIQKGIETRYGCTNRYYLNAYRDSIKLPKMESTPTESSRPTPTESSRPTPTESSRPTPTESSRDNRQLEPSVKEKDLSAADATDTLLVSDASDVAKSDNPPTPSQDKPKVPKERRNVWFDTIAAEFFGVHDTSKVGKLGARIGLWLKYLTAYYPETTRADLVGFRAWYRGKYPDCDLKSHTKFEEYYTAYQQRDMRPEMSAEDFEIAAQEALRRALEA